MEHNRFCCTDLEVMLYWIVAKKKSWKSWVENKELKVQKVVDKCKWSHVAGGENPANIPRKMC